MRILDQAQCRFGTIEVAEDQVSRWLAIATQIQGRSLLVPSSSDAVPGTVFGPGPISGSNVALAWLIAGTQHPTGRVLMIGLGAGASIVALLFNFPRMRMVVIEIEPLVVELALEHFPLLNHYRHCGRLEIRLADAAADIAQRAEEYDLAYVDAFAGEKTPSLVDLRFYRRLGQMSGDIWINFIGTLEGSPLSSLKATLEEARIPAACIVSPHPSTMMHLYDESRPRNWILATRRPAPEAARSFQPYGGLNSPKRVLDIVRSSYWDAFSRLRPLESARAAPAEKGHEAGERQGQM